MSEVYLVIERRGKVVCYVGCDNDSVTLSGNFLTATKFETWEEAKRARDAYIEHLQENHGFIVAVGLDALVVPDDGVEVAIAKVQMEETLTQVLIKK